MAAHRLRIMVSTFKSAIVKVFTGLCVSAHSKLIPKVNAHLRCIAYLQIKKRKINSKILESKTDDLERLSAAGNVKETASLTLTIAQVLNDPASSDEVGFFCPKRNSFCLNFFLTVVHSFALGYVNTRNPTLPHK